MSQLIFQKSPTVTVASNTFINVPVILQYEDTPLIEVVKEQYLGYTSSIPIYHPDGTYLAKVNGTRLYLTGQGKKAGIVLDRLADRTVCKMGDQVYFEIEHQPGDAFKTYAELYTPDGVFIKTPDSNIIDVLNKDALKIGGLTLIQNSFRNLAIGIHVLATGEISIGGRIQPGAQA
jgi:hypothetical protein